MDTAGSGNLQSGFVLVIVLAAFFFADRLGGREELGKRVLQVGLGVVLAFTVIAGTTAFVRAPSAPGSLLESTFNNSDESSSESLESAKDFNRDAANHDSARMTIHAGVGALLLVAGIAGLRRWPVTTLACALGGLLLILFGGVRTPTPGADQTGLNAFLSIYSSLIGGVFGGPSQSVDIIHFVVLAGAAVVMLALGFMRWDGRSEEAQAAAPETAA
jgi:hypothetical protein